MQVKPHVKNAIRYEWFDVLFDRFYSYEHCSDLPLNDIHQDIAKRITFGWGLAIGIGINLLLWLYLSYRLFGFGLPWMIGSAVGLLLFSIIDGALIGAGYLFITLYRIRRRELEQAEAQRPEKMKERKEETEQQESGDNHENG